MFLPQGEKENIRAGDGSVPFLACRIPDLCFDRLSIDRKTASGKLHTDSALGLKVELVASESREQVTWGGVMSAQKEKGDGNEKKNGDLLFPTPESPIKTTRRNGTYMSVRERTSHGRGKDTHP